MMKIGNYTLHAVLAGRFKLDGGAMFGVVPKVLWSKYHPADDQNRIEMVCRCLLVVGEGRVVLVNTGIGQNWMEKARSIYGIDQTIDLLTSLRTIGYEPEEVTDVIQTHLHFDHVGASTEVWEAVSRPAFPNALYYTQKKHYEWACRPSARDRASFRSDDWECIVGSDRMRMLEGEQELFPGFTLHVVHGHTPYQQLPRISDGHTSLLYCSDLIPFASQVRIPWVMSYDLCPVDTVREKKEILTQAVDENWFLFLEHDPLVEMCRVITTDKGFSASEPLSL